MRAKYTLWAITALVVISAPVMSSAGKVELTPYVGYRWSSQLTGTVVEDSDGNSFENIDFKSGATFGLWLDLRVGERLNLELLGEIFPSKIQGTSVETGAKTDVFDINLYYFQVGLQYEIVEYGVAAEDVKIRPFVYGGLGSTWMDPSGDRKSNARFNAAGAVGFKYMITELIGLRLQGRYIWTYMKASNDYWCTGDGTGTGEQCTVFPTSESLSQIDLTLGLIFAL